MSSQPAVGRPKAIYAPHDFLKVGEGVSKNFGFSKHLAIAMTVGVGLGMVWKTWHWNEKRYIAQYYADLAKTEAKEEAARVAALQEKFKALEAELSQ
mmetsp:Transcript_31416/g.69965  ORF Transcript_31416/g.69965 Transcript_31416/m.69965 type:complete len:97 (+) Transcript_31416:121-411(+)|eukprot:CAMPEP_0202899826 /NCGR_PEP_ID=MMETSP1392-20130828/8732_1 /ASSEMBLY_ACC=CAM_ASM_000868 /TAXON_ID=225041 /ORGANISM="Chlamydomonas chlamydogama, Strain SAG 11-48b" /LENGTH=96 /DNA_ID=CAMNT_0049586099 /DNA_START=121 /DNA_END=411 /DNA_ORIENTATION=+